MEGEKPLRPARPGACSPNPFREETTIRFGAFVPGTDSKIIIYDVSGRRVRGLDAGNAGGRVGATWDGRDDAGRPVPAGVYFARLPNGGRERTRKMVLVR